MSVKYCHQCVRKTEGTHPTFISPDFSTESSGLREHNPDCGRERSDWLGGMYPFGDVPPLLYLQSHCGCHMITHFVLSAQVPECHQLYLECKQRASNCIHICSLKILLYQKHITHINVYPRLSRFLLDLQSQSLSDEQIRAERWKV